ncbi:MAG: uridine-cytidine kinase [Victivallaceae bacterium]|nr:uridine-cytidine kinase [Victivallaceae bacterium]
MRRRTDIILVGGGSCSGKTTLAAELAEALHIFGTAAVISMDNYYFDLGSLTPAEADRRNFDRPEAVDFESLFRDLRDLRAGRQVRERHYDFRTHRVTETDRFLPVTDFIILEGIFALYSGPLRRLATAKIFVRADADLRLARRIERDTAVRRLPIELVIRQYLNDVRPMHAEYIEPYCHYADLMLDGNTAVPADNQRQALEFLREKLNGKK